MLSIRSYAASACLLGDAREAVVEVGLSGGGEAVCWVWEGGGTSSSI